MDHDSSPHLGFNCPCSRSAVIWCSHETWDPTSQKIAKLWVKSHEKTPLGPPSRWDLHEDQAPSFSACWRLLAALPPSNLVAWQSWSWPWLAFRASWWGLRLALRLQLPGTLGCPSHTPSPTHPPVPSCPALAWPRWRICARSWGKAEGLGLGGSSRCTVVKAALSGGTWLLPWSFSLWCRVNVECSSCHMLICCEGFVTKHKSSSSSLGKGLNSDEKSDPIHKRV